MAFAFVFLIGLCVGSLVNVLADRLPRGEPVIWGRSHCDFCGQTLRWYELMPIASYMLQMGRCRRCHRRLSWKHPVVELGTGMGFAALYAQNSANVIAIVTLWVFFTALLVIFLADFTRQIIPDSMVIVGTIAAAGYLLATPLSGDFVHHITPAVGTSLGFYLLWAATAGRGMGFGDVKLAFLLGLFLGFPLIVGALYVAFLTGAAVGVILILTGAKGLKSKIAFGPFLIFGLGVAYVWQIQLIALWHRFV